MKMLKTFSSTGSWKISRGEPVLVWVKIIMACNISIDIPVFTLTF
jgi:hypothetical protein